MESAGRKQSSVDTVEMSKPVTSMSKPPATTVPASRLGRLRPRSMYQTAAAPADKSTQVEKKTTSQSMQPPSMISKPSAEPSLGLSRTQSLRRPAVTTQSDPSLGLGRTQSLRRPNVTTQSGPSTASAAHSRTQSTSTVPLARSNTTRPRTNAERPKSMHVPPEAVSQISSNSAVPEPVVTRSSTRLAGLSRSASVKTRPEVAGGGMRPRATTRSEEPTLFQTKPKEPAKEEAKKSARPAFSTLQQHFTPRKTGKAPTATFLHPAPVAAGNNLPPELISLQMDLLQLHLLHEHAAEVSKQWEMSAKCKLHLKFDGVASMYQVMLEHERSGQEQKNLQALLEWTGDKPSASLVEHIHVLSGPLHGLPSLVQTGGRFQCLVGAFEQWMAWVEEVRSARQTRTAVGLRSIEGLGDGWKAENAALTRKLTSFARDLDGLSQPAAGSSIASIVSSCKTLLDGLLEELQTIQIIEAGVVAKEKDWVETRLQGIANDIGPFLVDEAPTWRT